MDNTLIAIAQNNTSVGDIEGNTEKAIRSIERARASGARVVVLTETAVAGYPPKDLLLSDEFVARCQGAQARVQRASDGIYVISGGTEKVEGHRYNSAFVHHDGVRILTYHKQHLPNYDVFDEKFYYTPGSGGGIFDIDGVRAAVNICEDVWIPGGPVEEQAAQGARVIFNLSASPFHYGKTTVRQRMIEDHIARTGVPIIYANQVGGQDDLVFDGESYAYNGRGLLVARGKRFEEDLVTFTLGGEPIKPRTWGMAEEVYAALVLGVRDFARKTGHTEACLGISGRRDSALVAAIAADALGGENVYCIHMPTAMSGPEARAEVRDLARRLGVRLETVPIDPILEAYGHALGAGKARAGGGEGAATAGAGAEVRATKASIRMDIVRRRASEGGQLVLSSANKTEAAVGQNGTLGRAGGYAPLIDVLDTRAGELAQEANRVAGGERIPPSVRGRHEARAVETGGGCVRGADLDAIIRLYVGELKGARHISDETGLDLGRVREVMRRIDAAQRQRQEMTLLGPTITPRPLGTGRRMPVANQYRH